jgi:putative tricarboxylic transport membrane protein
MELLDNLAFGFSVALSPRTLLYCFIGVTFGTFIGVLPGIGPLATIGLLLPITFHLSPIEGIIMLAGIYYGALYGGSTTAILLNLPGTAASVVVALDGHPMAKAGRPGPPLVMTTLVSFFAACVSIVIIAAFAPPLARFALRFGSPEYFSLMVMGLSGRRLWRTARCSRGWPWWCSACCSAWSGSTSPRPSRATPSARSI